MLNLFYSLLLVSGWGSVSFSFTRHSLADGGTHPAVPPLILLDSIQNATCADAADGAIFITAKQGQPPYTFAWSNGDTSQNLLDVPTGFYSCVVTDANDEQGFLADVFVGAPPALTVAVDTSYAPDCLGNPGYLAVSAEGGAPPYTFDWNNGQSGPELTDLPEGEYTVVVTDANGCTGALTVALFTDFPQAAATDQVITCSDPTVLLSGEESSTGDHITYSWTTADGLILSDPDSIVIVAGSGGIYSLLVTNTANGCTADAEAIVDVDTVPPVADAGADFTVQCTNSVDTLHGGGSAGAQFSYHWTAFDGGHLTGATDTSVAVFDHVGTFVLTVFDENNGCSASDTIVVDGLNEPPAALAFGDTLTCTVDSVVLTAQFDPLNTQFAWQGPGGFTSGLENPKVGDPGVYVLTVTDTLTGCFSVAPALVVLDTAPPVILYSFAGAITCVDESAQIGVETDTAIATVFYWTGPDNFEAFEQSPTVGLPGEYIVIATNFANGCTATDTVTVEGDFAPPHADAGADATLTCLTATLTLDGSGSTQGNSIAYAWITADGNILGGDSSQTPVVNAVGTYTLIVANLNNGCTATDEVLVDSETTQPAASATVSDTLSCLTAEVQIFGESDPAADVAFAWTGPGGFMSDEQNPFVSSAGDYALVVTYLPSGCTAIASVSVSSNAPGADAGPGGDLTCMVTSLQLDGTGSATGDNLVYLWTTADGNIVDGENTLTPTVDAVGTYLLTVADTLNNCSSSAETTVGSDLTAPLADAGPDGFLNCAIPTITLDGTGSTSGANIAYAWSTADGNIVAGSNTPTPSVDAAGEYELVVTNLTNGCTASDIASVGADQAAPTAVAAVNGMLTCVMTSVQLNGDSNVPGANFHWEGPDGFSSDQQNPQAAKPGEYTLLVLNPANGCTATATVTVMQNIMPPTLSASGGQITCAHPTVTIMTSVQPANTTFIWTGPGNFSSTAQNPIVSQPGIYNVVATNPMNGCTNAVSVAVTQNITPPTVSASGGTLTCLQSTINLNATGTPAGLTFAWSGPNGFTANIANPAVNEAGDYTVVATSPVNGCTAITYATVADNTQPPTAYAGEDSPLSCLNGLLTLSGLGSSSGSQFVYAWTTQDGNFVVGQNTLMPRVDAPGTYTLIVINTSNGCTAADSVLVTEPVPVTAVITQTQSVSCHGGADGSVTVLAGGGTQFLYTYIWSNGAATATAGNLSAGIYAVTVYDSEGCSASASATISEPSQLSVNVTSTAQTLPGIDDGTASAAGQGGTAPYTYLWSTGATTAAINGLAPGVYFVTTTDAKGCTATGVANVNPSNCALSVTVATTAPLCFGQSNGSATASAAGAAGAVAYAWSNGATTPTALNLAAGLYSLTATDAAGCTVVASAQIIAPQPLTLALLAQQNIECTGDSDGALGAAAGGGTAPYNYAWSTGGAGSNLSGLGAGTYTLTTTDAHGCSKTLEATIVVTDVNPPVLILQNATVALNANGLATLTPALFDAGSADAECAIASLTVSPTSFGCGQLGPHTVTLTATDVNGNMATATATVTIIDNIVPTLDCPDNIAVGACQSTVEFALPLVLDNCPIDPGQLALTAGLPSGSIFPEGTTQQTFTYTDAAGNSGACIFDVIVSPALSVAVQSVPASCGPASCDGQISLDLAGGTPPYSIAWNTGATGAVLNNLCPGEYAATATDAQGCSQILIANIVSADQEPPVLALQNAEVALGPNGIAVVTPALFDIGSTDNCGDFVWGIDLTEFSCAELGQHVVTLTATDASGNSASQTVTATVVDDIAPTLMCPDDLVASLCAATVDYQQPLVLDNCPLAQLELTAGLPSGSQFPAGTTVQVFTAADSSGNTGTCSFTVTVQNELTVASSLENVSCSGDCDGAITLTPGGGGGPYTAVWSNGATGLTLENLCAGAYGATVTDASGCSQSLSFDIDEPEALSATVTDVQHDLGNTGVGSISVDVAGGTAPYTYVWQRDGQLFADTEDLSGLFAGLYQLDVTDANGCSVASIILSITNITVAATEPAGLSDWALSPNPASDQVELRFGTAPDEPLTLTLSDAVGRPVRTEQIEPGARVVRLDLAGLPAGIWHVRLQSAGGQRAAQHLIIAH